MLLAALALSATASTEDEPAWVPALATDLQPLAMTPDEAAELAATMAAYDRAPRGPRLDAGRLDAILSDLDWEAPEPASLLSRVWRWLEERLRESGVELNLDWLQGLAKIPTSAFEWIARVSMAVMIVVAGVLVVNELRHGRRRRWRRPAAWLSRGDDGPSGVVPLPSFADIHRLPPRERPGAALRLVLATLSARGEAFAGDGATHREIAARADGLGAVRASVLAQLASLAERARFGRWNPQRDERNDAVALARRVLGETAAATP